VTADGQLRTASAAENEDLFWAVRGAGSNFGVITSFEFQLHPVGPMVFLCAAVYSLEDGPRVLRAWRDLIKTMPDEFTPIAIFWSGPPGFPDFVVGKPIVILAGVYAGPIEEGERVTQPFRAAATPLLDLSEAVPFVGAQSGFDAFFPKGLLQYWKSTFLEELSDDLIDRLCQISAERPSPLTTMDIWPQLGAAARVAPEATAFGRRPPFMVAFESSWTDPAATEANIAWARTANDSMSRFSGAGIYLNFPGFADEQEDKARTAYGANYDRLARIKGQYDPTNLFRMNSNIRPVAPAS